MLTGNGGPQIQTQEGTTSTANNPQQQESTTSQAQTHSGPVQPIDTVQSGQCYQSPVNPNNPVWLCRDANGIYFRPAQSQIDSGRTNLNPQPRLVIPPDYTPVEIFWDWKHEEITGGGPIVIRMTSPGREDARIAISNTLEQKSYFEDLPDSSQPNLHVAREGGEFIRSYDTNVSARMAGSPDGSPVTQINFNEGYLRYRGPGGDHDLYVARGANPAVYLIERSTGDIKKTFPTGRVQAVVPAPDGTISVEVNEPRQQGNSNSQKTYSIDLRQSAPAFTETAGFNSEEPGYDTSRQAVADLGINITEEGLRLKVAELNAVHTALTDSGDHGLNILRQFRAIEDTMTDDEPILDLTKRLGPDSGRGLAEAGMGRPMLSISEPFTTSETNQVATVRHEITHVIMGAADAVRLNNMSRQERANNEGAMRFAARRASEKARQGLLRQGEYGMGDPVPAAGSARDFRGAMGDHPQLAGIWVELLRRYTFIQDPEGTGEFRGASLADESRYLGMNDNIGHPADSIGEFVASFVTCASMARTQFVDAVNQAANAGNARGGRGGSYLKSLFRRSWNIISSTYVPLGGNPF